MKVRRQYSFGVRPGKVSQKRRANPSLEELSRRLGRARVKGLSPHLPPPQGGPTAAQDTCPGSALSPGLLIRKASPAPTPPAVQIPGLLDAPVHCPTSSLGLLAITSLPGGALLCARYLSGGRPAEPQLPWDWSGTGLLLSHPLHCLPSS